MAADLPNDASDGGQDAAWDVDPSLDVSVDVTFDFTQDLTSDLDATSDVLGVDLSTVWEGGSVQVLSISAGHAHACALLDSGEAVCWGSNSGGQLGDGTFIDRSTPVFVHGLDDAIQISAGWLHTCAVRGGGGVLCWGQNLFGSVGDGTSAEARPTPTAVLDIADGLEVRATVFSSCARRATGSVSCWGFNGAGQLGDGTLISRPRPVTVRGLDQVSRLAQGGGHYSCAERLGEVLCWGINDEGQLGGGTAGGSNLGLVTVVALSDAVEVATAFTHACARRQNGEVVCWGGNAAGQIGDGSTDPQLRPFTVVGLVKARNIATQMDHVCADDDEGGVVCWGSNGYGQLGDGSTTQSSLPVVATGLGDVLQVAVGTQFSCALQVGDRIHCWGSGKSGQLGDGRMSSSIHPAPVLLP